MLIEHDPDHPLSKVITRMFGEERPKLNETEKKERQSLKVGRRLIDCAREVWIKMRSYSI